MNTTLLLVFSDLLTIENLAVFFSIGFVIFNAKGKIISWPLGIIGSALYIWVFYEAKIYGDAFLQFFYVIMGIYGWLEWYSAKKSKSDLVIDSASFRSIAKFIFLGFLLIPVTGFILDHYTDSDIPYWDAYTTIFSFIATYMMAKRLLENWIFWIVIDLSCIFIYLYKGLNATVFLFFIYTLMAIYGYFNWRVLKNKSKINA